MPMSTTPTTPSTLLDAINVLLNGIRADAVISLTQVENNEWASRAKDALDATSRNVQAKGWEFNEDIEVTLLPDLSGEITLGIDILKATMSRSHTGDAFVQRGRKLWNKANHNWTFTDSVVADTVTLLEFADLSEAWRALITALAARAFCLPRLPEGATFRYTEEFVAQCQATAEQEDADAQDQSLKDTSPHFADMARR